MGVPEEDQGVAAARVKTTRKASTAQEELGMVEVVVKVPTACGVDMRSPAQHTVQIPTFHR